MEEISTVLHEVATDACYDGFIHYAQLGEWSRESGIPFREWRVLLDTWDYNPHTFISQFGRGNCVDFAAYAVERCAENSIEAHTVGMLPGGSYYNARQESFLDYQHIAIAGRDTNQQHFIAEPGWNLPYPMPIQLGSTVELGKYTYSMTEITDGSITQCYTTEIGEQQRIFHRAPMETEALVQTTKDALRLPNRMMSLSARLGQNPRENKIIVDARSDLLKASKLPYLPDVSYHPREITNQANKELSTIFGFDVKEELLACYAVKRALPEVFWVR